MNYRILKVKNDIELFLKDNMEHQNKHIDYILFNPRTNDTYVLASDGYDEAIEFTPYSKSASMTAMCILKQSLYKLLDNLSTNGFISNNLDTFLLSFKELFSFIALLYISLKSKYFSQYFSLKILKSTTITL